MSTYQPPTRTLGSILVECGIVTDAELGEAVKLQRETGHMIGESLVELGFTSEENIGWALSKQLSIPYADVHPSAIDPDLVRRFPEPLLRRVQSIPLFSAGDEITIAMADPTDMEAVNEVSSAAGVRPSLVIGGPASIRRALDSVFGPPRSAAEAAARHSSGTVAPDLGEAAGPGHHDVVWDRAGTTFLLYHLHAARRVGASEVHFIPHGSDLSVAYRTDRGLQGQPYESPETAIYLRARLAILGVPDLEDPSRTCVHDVIHIDVAGTLMRVGVYHCRVEGGIATVLRIGPSVETAPDLATLGLSPLGEAEIRDILESPEGIVLLYGPPRAGGSTILSSLVAAATRSERRTLIFEGVRTRVYPSDAVCIRVREGDDVDWSSIAVGMGADVVVLDGVLPGHRIEEILGGASVGRLVFARTDWLDGPSLLDYLARNRNGRAVFRDRPIALIALPVARREGSAAWVTPEPDDRDAGLLEVTVLGDEDRDALLADREGGSR